MSPGIATAKFIRYPYPAGGVNEGEEMAMNKLTSIAAVGLVVMACVLPGLSQEMASKDGPKPPRTGSRAVLESWNEIGGKLIAMAEDFPEDKYDFKPNPAQRTFAQQLLHAAGDNYFFTNLALGQKPPSEEDPKRDQYKTKADVVAFVKKSFADGAAAISSKGDAGMAGMVTDPDSHRQLGLSDLAYALIEHSGEHYGQLAVYYRVAGLVPPASRPKK